MAQVFLLKLENGASLEVRADDELGLKPHDMCVFSKDFYSDLGEVRRELKAPSMTSNPAELPQVQHQATTDDLIRANANTVKARSAMRTARQLVESLNLPMKLVNAHYTLDGKLVTIQFSADGRVDFRELVKELSRALATRIELRQIGVRDETGIYGGIAVCGQELCCCRYLKEFNSINVKMAKEQDLSLTPATISGICGRLKCCLKFEHEGYLLLEKGMPRKGEYCDTPSGRGRICDRNLLTRKVMVSLEGGNTVQFSVEDVTVTPSERRGGNSGGQAAGSASRRSGGDRNPNRRQRGGNGHDDSDSKR